MKLPTGRIWRPDGSERKWSTGYIRKNTRAESQNFRVLRGTWLPVSRASQHPHPHRVSSLPTWSLGLAMGLALAKGTLASAMQNGDLIRVCTRELVFLVAVVLDAPSWNQASVESNGATWGGHMKNGSLDQWPPPSIHATARTTG